MKPPPSGMGRAAQPEPEQPDEEALDRAARVLRDQLDAKRLLSIAERHEQTLVEGLTEDDLTTLLAVADRLMARHERWTEPEPQRSTCPRCNGSGTYQEDPDRHVLLRCPTCLGAGCDHHAAWTVGKDKTDGHCSLCEQDDSCRACQREEPGHGYWEAGDHG